MRIRLVLLTCPLIALARTTSSSGPVSAPWKDYILSPASRTVPYVSTRSPLGHEQTTWNASNHTLNLYQGDTVTLDFGVEIGGLCAFHAVASSLNNSIDSHLSLSFAESPSFIRPISDDTGATPTQDWDMALNVSLPSGPSMYRMPRDRFRGGFRFVTVRAFHDVSVSNFTCEIGFAPGMADLRAYSGYFYTPDDDLLTRVWYAGAYTTQTNIAPSDTGRWLPQVRPGWAYNATLGVTGPVLVDGAKRDRAVWPGDLGISAISAYLALGDIGLLAVHNAIETIFTYQNSSTGMFPFAGPATGSFRSGAKSDTYHAWSLIAIYNHAIFTGNSTWLDFHWANITRGLDYIVANVANNASLHNQANPNGWARQGGGGYNSALNALDYRCLIAFSSLALSIPSKNETLRVQRESQRRAWNTAATQLKTSFNNLLWDSLANLYRDNQTTAGSKLHPQDGNALALLFNLTSSSSHSSSISESLTQNWNTIGPVTPELPDTISPFVSGIEVLAHFAAGYSERALGLVRMTWGYLLDSPLMTGSTLAEGITANGSLYYRSTAGYKYDASYTSLSHSWSTAPTQALMSDVVGISLTGWMEWRFRPRPGDLKAARGGFRSPVGGFEAVWAVKEGRLDAELVTPNGTSGSMDLPWTCETIACKYSMVIDRY